MGDVGRWKVFTRLQRGGDEVRLWFLAPFFLRRFFVFWRVFWLTVWVGWGWGWGEWLMEQLRILDGWSRNVNTSRRRHRFRRVYQTLFCDKFSWVARTIIFREIWDVFMWSSGIFQTLWDDTSHEQLHSRKDHMGRKPGEAFPQKKKPERLRCEPFIDKGTSFKNPCESLACLIGFEWISCNDHVTACAGSAMTMQNYHVKAILCRKLNDAWRYSLKHPRWKHTSLNKLTVKLVVWGPILCHLMGVPLS